MKTRNLFLFTLGSFVAVLLWINQPLQAQSNQNTLQRTHYWQHCGFRCHNFMRYQDGYGQGRWHSTTRPHMVQLMGIRRALGISPYQLSHWNRFEDAMLQAPPWLTKSKTTATQQPQTTKLSLDTWWKLKIERVSHAYSCLFEQLDRFQRSRALRLLGTPYGEAKDGIC
ncbi:hypothetical protein [Magnetococcus sp. PR-3]|uniref:hypothetical protein n=1 Tax=Magnetococcus sp. PR-3 TaxID=3120355 RepID=UPI002FCE4BDF